MSRLINMLLGWEEVLVTPDQNQYMKMKYELNNKGIRTRSEFSNSKYRGAGGPASGVSMYYLYVKKNKSEKK